MPKTPSEERMKVCKTIMLFAYIAELLNDNVALNYLRLASRIDAVASRVETAVRMKTVTRSMTGIVKVRIGREGTIYMLSVIDLFQNLGNGQGDGRNGYG